MFLLQIYLSVYKSVCRFRFISSSFSLVIFFFEEVRALTKVGFSFLKRGDVFSAYWLAVLREIYLLSAVA